MSGGLGGSLPIAASEVAHSWDLLYYFLFAICGFFFVLVCGAMIVFAIRYRAKPGIQASYITHNDKLEIVWTIIPTILVMIIFVWGWIVYSGMGLNRPTDAMEVKVLAKQWNWTFQYDDGRTMMGEFVVPVNKPVKLVMTSNIKDVLHSFFLPNFRLKKDVVPGMFTSLWIKPTIIGTHQVFCAEYCGTDHSNMLAKMHVVSDEDWQKWRWGGTVAFGPNIGIVGDPIVETSVPLAGTAGKSNVMLADEGKKLTQTKGCIACHSDDGSARIGPSYKGIFGHEVELVGGVKVVVDENYIRESVMTPQAKIVKGFETMIMPPYAGQISDSEMIAIIEYIKSVK